MKKMFANAMLCVLALALGVATGCSKSPESYPGSSAEKSLVSKMVIIDSDLTIRFGETEQCTTTDAEICLSNQPWPGVLVTLKPFAIDMHEVTNSQYWHCVKKGACTHPDADGTGGTQTDVTLFPYYDDKTYDAYPMVNVSYKMAEAYCKFVGKRLPTELEWERVALTSKFTEESRPRYIWGSDADGCKGKNVRARFCSISIQEPGQVMTSTDDVVLVNTKIPDPELYDNRVYDLQGNVEEWVSTVWLEGRSCKASLQFSTDKKTGDCPDFFECSSLSSSNWTDCMNRAVNCPQCLQNGKDICHRVTDNSDCCVGSQCRPVCIAFDKTTPITPDKLRIGADPNLGTVKGASYIASNKCQLRITRRRVVAHNQPAKNLGFRCARDFTARDLSR